MDGKGMHADILSDDLGSLILHGKGGIGIMPVQHVNTTFQQGDVGNLSWYPSWFTDVHGFGDIPGQILATSGHRSPQLVVIVRESRHQNPLSIQV